MAAADHRGDARADLQTALRGRRLEDAVAERIELIAALKNALLYLEEEARKAIGSEDLDAYGRQQLSIIEWVRAAIKVGDAELSAAAMLQLELSNREKLRGVYDRGLQAFRQSSEALQMGPGARTDKAEKQQAEWETIVRDNPPDQKLEAIVALIWEKYPPGEKKPSRSSIATWYSEFRKRR